MDFAMDIDKLNLVNLVGKEMDKIMEYQGYLQFSSTASHKIIKSSRSPFWVQNNTSTSYILIHTKTF